MAEYDAIVSSQLSIEKREREVYEKVTRMLSNNLIQSRNPANYYIDISPQTYGVIYCWIYDSDKVPTNFAVKCSLVLHLLEISLVKRDHDEFGREKLVRVGTNRSNSKFYNGHEKYIETIEEYVDAIHETANLLTINDPRTITMTPKF